MPSGLLLDYTVWVFFCAIGAVQIACARSGLAGLLLLRRSYRGTHVLGASLIAGATLRFFASDHRNLPDTAGGLEANSQALWFALASATAMAATYVLSSAINERWAARGGQNPGDGEPPYGLGRLRRTTFLRAFVASARVTVASMASLRKGRS
jgi:hypothetical protein